MKVRRLSSAAAGASKPIHRYAQSNPNAVRLQYLRHAMHTHSPVHFYPSTAPSVTPASDVHAIIGGRVELQLLTTLKCNLKCSYCSLGVGDVLGSQVHVEYDIEQLVSFVDKHLQEKEVYVTFYGGEPTLNK